ncbi:MAG TPA: DNA-directed DNA polymerase II small subunit [Candidatus Sulfopaludibacter sp.]|nr:DNA-directed DNA polymerase II small subunit [Candidatus Sulfopaludibacter sp.]
MTVNNNLSKIISFVTSKGFQIHPDALILIEKIQDNYFQIIEDILLKKKKRKEKSMVIISDDIKNFSKFPSYEISNEHNNFELLNSETSSITEQNNKYKYDNEMIKDKNFFSIKKDNLMKYKENIDENFKIIYDSNDKINSGEGVEGYTSLFRSRYEKSLKILSLRQDSRKVKKIEIAKQLFNQSKINYNSMSKEDLDNSIFIAGLVMSKDIKNNNYDITIDDQTGLLTATTYNEELKKQISMLTVDQMVMIEFENNPKRRKNTIKNIFSLDIPDRIPNRSKSEIFSILISDLHIGSKFFMEKEFQNFLEWLNGNGDNKEIISKIKYICICGDLIDGIGIFPNQDKELLEKDSYSQMDHAIKILSKIPKHMKVFLIPGNHDLGRRALPQPAIPKKYAEKLYSLDNVTMLGNPCMIRMEGIKILMFHGQSLDDVIASIPGLSYSKPAEAMKLLLKSRHLSPIFGQRTPIAPEKEDMMIIEDVPDILHSGHVHVIDVDSYKGTLIVNSGAWQSQTPFQQTMGITPTPGIAIAINLSNLKPYKIDFNN